MSILTIALIGAFTVASGAGDSKVQPAEETLSHSVEQVVVEREHDFRLERAESGGDQISRVWRSRKAADSSGDARSTSQSHQPAFVSVQIFRLASEAEAEAALKRIVPLISVGPSGSVEDLGDESYIWTGYSSSGASVIRFRKANVMMWVSASPFELANRFAFHMLAAIDDRLAAAKTGVVENYYN
jgi:hypothetical protein